MAVDPIRPGLHTITPNICVQDCANAIEFYKKAFGAVEVMRMSMPGSDAVMHAELRIGNSIFFLNDEFPEMESYSPLHYKGTTCSLMLAVEDVDAVFAQAVAAGCTVDMPLAEMFWGDRFASVSDPYGHSWGMSTRTRDMTPEQMAAEAKSMFEAEHAE